MPSPLHSVVVAIISPILSSIADYRGIEKLYEFFPYDGEPGMRALFFFRPRIPLPLYCCVCDCLHRLLVSLVYYNSFLPEIAAHEDRDRVSARGFAYGTFGSVILQVICLIFVMKRIYLIFKRFNLPFQLSFLLVGLWWWGFVHRFHCGRLPNSTPAVPDRQKNIFTTLPGRN